MKGIDQNLSINTKTLENTQKPKEDKAEKESPISTIEINGIPIEVKKSYFEYPEKIQKETGILGYERMMISKDQIEKIFTPKLSEEERKNLSMELLKTLTNNKFPDECFTYIMMTTKEGKEQFVNDKLILQNIFDFDTYNKLAKIESNKKFSEERNSVFRSDGFKRDSEPDYSLFTPVSKIDNKIIKQGDGHTTGNVNYIYSSFKEKILKDEISIISANGLNVSAREFFFDYNIFDNNPAFGFYRKDKLFQDYISKSINRLREINLANENSPDENGYQQKVFSNRIFLDLFAAKEFENKKEDFNKNGFGFKEFLGSDLKNKQFTEDLIKKYGSALSEKPDDMYKLLNNDYLLDENENLTWYGKESRGDIDPKNSNSSSSSWHIPIFVNDKEVENLKWGHASFSAFFTKNGFNVLNIRHLDYFPKKEE